MSDTAIELIETAPSVNPTPLQPITPGTGEGCPTPIYWKDILEAYARDSTPWELNRGSRKLIGRCWGTGPSLYLLNGFVGSSELYALLIWLLRDTYRCIVYDTVRTSFWSRSATMKDFADDLMAVADMNGDSTIDLFGPSFGAGIALQATVDHPGRIQRIALQHGFASRKLSWFERRLAGACGWTGMNLASLPGRRRIQELNNRRWFPPFDASRFEFLLDSTGKIPLSTLAEKAKATHAFDVSADLACVKCPVLLLRTEGQGMPETEALDVLEKTLPDHRTESMHSAGLHPYLTHPHKLAKLLRAFFTPTNETSTSVQQS